MKKCCWSKCNKKATCGSTHINGKGNLQMCEGCYNDYLKHTNAREKMFREDGQMLGLKAGLEVAKDIAKREGFEFVFPDVDKILIKQDAKQDNGD